MSDKSKFSITLDKISKSYPNKVVLKDIQISFDSSRIYGLIGANGAGKTTLLEIMVGLKSANSGNIQFISIKKHLGLPKEQLGFAGQIPILWNRLTCLEHGLLLGRFYNIPKSILNARINKLLLDFQLTEYKNYQIDNLSGGLKQRLNLALSLLHMPRILIWDEPTTGLDIESKLLLRNFLINYSKESQGITIISSHDLFELEKLCTEFIFLDHGSIIAKGSFTQLQQIDKLKEDPSIKINHLEDIYRILVQKQKNETHLFN